jgi:hypothetical protein
VARIRGQLQEGVGAYSRPGFDYAATLLKASRKDPAALATFLQNCHQVSSSAAGNEMNNAVMLGLLLRWGDFDFAAIVARQKPAVRKDLFDRFPYRGGDADNLAHIFPLTAKACGRKIGK